MNSLQVLNDEIELTLPWIMKNPKLANDKVNSYLKKHSTDFIEVSATDNSIKFVVKKSVEK